MFSNLTKSTDHIPTEMKEADRWLLWKLTSEGKKVPIHSESGHAHSATDSDEWLTFDEAVAACDELCSRGLNVGLGFAIGGEWVGIDWDNAIATHEDGTEKNKPFSTTLSRRWLVQDT